jgi:hypothetical protein
MLQRSAAGNLAARGARFRGAFECEPEKCTLDTLLSRLMFASAA